MLNRDGTTRQNELPAPQTEDETILDAFDDNFHKALAELWMLLDSSIQIQVLAHKTGPSSLWNGLSNRFATESAAVEIRRATNKLAVVRQVNLSEVKEFLSETFGAVATLSRHGQCYLVSSLVTYFEKCLPSEFKTVLESLDVADSTLSVSTISMKLHHKMNTLELKMN